MQLETNCLAKKPTTGYLKSWAEQGVFCLNVTLTVRQGDPNSHETKKRDGNVGWKYFTSNVLKKLSREKENLVFFGWGKNAENIIAEVSALFFNMEKVYNLSNNERFYRRLINGNT